MFYVKKRVVLNDFLISAASNKRRTKKSSTVNSSKTFPHDWITFKFTFFSSTKQILYARKLDSARRQSGKKLYHRGEIFGSKYWTLSSSLKFVIAKKLVSLFDTLCQCCYTRQASFPKSPRLLTPFILPTADHMINRLSSVCYDIFKHSLKTNRLFFLKSRTEYFADFFPCHVSRFHTIVSLGISLRIHELNGKKRTKHWGNIHDMQLTLRVSVKNRFQPTVKPCIKQTFITRAPASSGHLTILPPKENPTATLLIFCYVV